MYLIKHWTLLLFLLCSTLATAAQQKVTGRVTDAAGNGIPGVTVRIQQTNKGTITDVSGRYSLDVPQGSTLTFSFTGYKTYQAVVSGNTLDAQLQEDYANLDEVVVTGLATSVKRSNLANAVATISAKELYGVAPAQTFDAALSGKIPGALINANSGAPGGGISVKMRGVTTVFGNSQPLYVVDGVFISNVSVAAGLNIITAAASAGNPQNQDNPSSRVADINPEDIENIEILKGASAAAIYGSKAAAGVMIITTKKGSIGKPTVRLTQDLGVTKVRKLLGVRRFTEETAFALGGATARDQFVAARNAGKLYDYEKEMYGENGLISNTGVSVSGGDERTSVYFSANRRSEAGIIKNSGYLNNSVRVNVDHKLSDRVSVGLRTAYMNTSADRGLTNNDNNSVTYGVSLATIPEFLELHPDEFGNYPVNPKAANPLETRDKMRNNESVNRFITAGEVKATLHQRANTNTKLIVRGGIDFFNLKTEAVFPRSLQFMKGGLNGVSIQGNTNNLNTNLMGALVNYFEARSKLTFTTSLGATLETSYLDNLVSTATNLLPQQTNVDQASASQLAQFRLKYRDNGIFLQEEVSIIDAITVAAGVRLDRSTNNGDYKKYFVLPKAAVSWNLAKMEFWNIPKINSFKLRAAYGEAGNVAPYGSKFLALTASNTGGQPGSLVDTQLGNEDIKPERQTELEAGLDMSFFNGRLTVDATYYQKKIYDLLLRSATPPSTGFLQKWVNGGDLQNKGVELSITGIPVDTRKVRWVSTVNFWKNKSDVTRLTIPAFPLGAFGNTLGNFFIEEGKSATQIIGTLGAGKGVGVLGNAEPDFQMSFFNELTVFSNLTLRVMMHWKKGGDNINLTEYLSDIFGTSYDYDEDKNGNGVKDGLDRMAAANSNDASVRVQDATYFRIREIGLYYQIPIPKNRYISGVKVGVSASNWFTFTDYKSYDPEASNFGSNTMGTATTRGSNGISTGVEVTPYPATKRAMFHLGVTF